MERAPAKIGLIVPCWDSLSRDPVLRARFMDCAAALTGGSGFIVLSLAYTGAISTRLRDVFPTSFLCDVRTLSVPRLARLCDRTFVFDGHALVEQPASPALAPPCPPRFGFVVSNGFGLGHVTRAQTLAKALSAFGPCAFMSFSAALVRHDRFPVMHLASAQYLDIPAWDEWAYTREETLRFFNSFAPTHVIYDGNVIPSGLASALATRPQVHFTWVRRGMWRADVAPHYMAQQALADLVIEPGDFAESLDTGPSWTNKSAYCPPLAFLKTPPIKPHDLEKPPLPRADALRALGLDPAARHVLVMPGAARDHTDIDFARAATDAIRRVSGLTPVLAHWPISHEKPPVIDGVHVIEKIPLAPYFKGFDAIVSAAGYNSFHELVASGVPTVFIPQDDALRDRQVDRARFALQQNLAALCPRESIDTLDQTLRTLLAAPTRPLLAAPTPPVAPLAWMQDWHGLARAMAARTDMQARTEPENAGLPYHSGQTRATIERIFQHWRQKSRLFFGNRLVLATDMDFSTFSARYQPDDGALTPIVLTNSINPIDLRRNGYKYLWLNHLLPAGSVALKRQILSWLNIWRPESFTTL